MDEFDALPDVVIRQLAELRQRLEEHDGALRVCGLQEACAAKLENFRLDHALHCHPSRESAVLGSEHAHECLQATHCDLASAQSSKSTSGTAAEVALTR
ncbi:MAG: STAS domain-containing protein [Aeoliella sp.]